MATSFQQQVLALISDKQLTEAIALLQGELNAENSARRRVDNLSKRLQELEGRVTQGTLANEEVKRLRDRIAGGLRDVTHNLGKEPEPAEEQAAKPEEKFVFKFRKEEGEEAKPAPPTANFGYKGEISYKGSPSKKERSIELVKSYGAAIHQVTQAIKKAGMTMEKADREGGRLFASAPAAASNQFGLVVEAWIKPENKGRTWVHVVVDSASPTTMMDFGRHENKLNLLFSYLR